MHKETLKLEHHELKPEPKADPPTRQQFDDFNKTKRVETDMRVRKNYSEAPVVQQTMSSFKSSTVERFGGKPIGSIKTCGTVKAVLLKNI